MRLSLKDQIDALCAIGYTKETAQAKVVHDAVLLAMSRCGFKMNSTVKGGVVMSSLTGNVRRATMDMDIDFIHYSISDVSVRRFVSRLTKSIPELELKMIGTPIELKHEDYRGKRIYLAIRDASIRRWMRTKVDIGVHKRESIEQIDFSFTTASSLSAVKLQATPPRADFRREAVELVAAWCQFKSSEGPVRHVLSVAIGQTKEIEGLCRRADLCEQAMQDFDSW